MTYRAIFCLILFLVSTTAHAQNTQCRTAPVGTSTSNCASEAFVTQSIGGLSQLPNNVGIGTPALPSFGLNVASNVDGSVIPNDAAGFQSAPILYYSAGAAGSPYTNGWAGFYAPAYTSCALNAVGYPNCTGAPSITITLGGGLRILKPFLLGTPAPVMVNLDALHIDDQSGVVTGGVAYALHTYGATPSLFEGGVIVKPLIVSTLPTCNSTSQGMRSFVTDATSVTYHATAVGSGTNRVGVICDGVIWYVS